MKLKGISAIIATLLILVITLGLAGLAYTYIKMIFTTRMATLSLVDSYCYGSEGYAIIKNEGTTPINTSTIILTKINSDCEEPSSIPDTIQPGESVELKFTNCGTGRGHVWRLRGPANAFEITFYCT